MTTVTNSPQSGIGVWINRLRAAIKSGTLIDLSPGVPDALIDRDWLLARAPGTEIPAAALRKVLLDTRLAYDPRGLTIRGALISGVLDLDYTIIKPRISIIKSVFLEPPSFQHSSMSVLDLSGSVMPGTRLNFARVSGSVSFFEASSSREVRLSNAEIGGRLNMARAEFEAQHTALNLDAARIQGDVLLDKLRSRGEVRAEAIQVTGRLILSGASLQQHRGDTALNLNAANIRGDVFLDGGLTAEGEVSAHGTEFGGQLHLTGANLHHRDGVALNLDAATIAGDVFADDIEAQGEVRAAASRIGGQLHLRSTQLLNPGHAALSLEGSIIEGDFFMDGGAIAEGEVRAHAARFGGQLNLENAKLLNPSGVALNLTYARIIGSAFLNGGMQVEGEVRAHGAVFGGQLNMQKASIKSAGSVAIKLDYAEVAGSVFLTDGIDVEGEVRAHSCRVGGQMNLREGKFSNPGEVALRLSSAKLQSLHLAPAKVSGQINLAYAEVQTLATAKEKPAEGLGLPDLSSAQEWKLNAIHGFLKHDRRAVGRWLDTVPRSKKEFVSQPWKEAAAVFDRMGQAREARWLRYEAAKRVTRIARWWSKPLHWLYRWTVGYGYFPLRTFFWITGAVALAFTLAFGHAGEFTPTNREAAKFVVVDREGQSALVTGATSTQPPNYPAFNPILYALDTALPAVDTAQAKNWQIASSALLPTAFAGIKSLSWLLAALLLAGLTGILRKD